MQAVGYMGMPYTLIITKAVFSTVWKKKVSPTFCYQTFIILFIGQTKCLRNFFVSYLGRIGGWILLVFILYDFFFFRFTVNLLTSAQGGNIALHINPRFSEGCVVRNSNYNGWGHEERAGGLPVGRGQHFELTVIAKSSSYEVIYSNTRGIGKVCNTALFIY